MSAFQAVEIPPRMRHLKKDRRGYPIPDVVQLDTDGRPHFTINDEAKRQGHIHNDKCPICGTSLFRLRWFVGGPMSAFHVSGMYIDTPMHHECMNYALRVCPYLAAPNYGKRIDDATLDPAKLPEGVVIGSDPTLIPNRPDVFVAVGVMREHVLKIPDPANLFVRYLKVKRGRHHAMEFWVSGVKITDDKAVPLLVEYFKNAGLGDLSKQVLPMAQNMEGVPGHDRDSKG